MYYIILLLFDETASQSLALYERVWCTYVVSKRRLRGRTYEPCLLPSAARYVGGGRLQRRGRTMYDAYGVATAAPAGVARQRNKQTNRQTDKQTNRQTDRQTDRQCSNYN